MTRPSRPRPGRNRSAVRTAVAGAVLTVLLVLASAGPALAVDPGGAPSLNQVIDNLRNVIIGLMAGAATLFLTVGGARYLSAGGDPGEVEKAKRTLRSAAVGYGIAALAPVLFALLKTVVGQ